MTFLPKPLLVLLIFLSVSCSAVSQPKADIDMESVMKREGYERIALDKLPTGHDVVSARINGVSGKFILDTGASISTINESVSAKYKVGEGAFIKTDKGAGAGGDFMVDFYEVSHLALGSRSVDISAIGMMDLSAVIGALSRIAGYQIDGIIGHDVVIDQNGILDGTGNSLYVRDEPTASTSGFDDDLIAAGFTALPVKKLKSGNKTLPVTINGASGVFIIDSGSRASFINTHDLEKFGIDAVDRTTGRQRTVGASGGTRIENYTITSIQLAGYTLELPAIGAIDFSAVAAVMKEQADTEINGVIGQNILAKHLAVIDVPGERIFLHGLP